MQTEESGESQRDRRGSRRRTESKAKTGLYHFGEQSRSDSALFFVCIFTYAAEKALLQGCFHKNTWVNTKIIFIILAISVIYSENVKNISNYFSESQEMWQILLT